MSILVKHILKTLLKIYDGFCVKMDFSYELFVLVKRSPVHILFSDVELITGIVTAGFSRESPYFRTQ